MKKNNLPSEIAIFPLSNAVFFPRTVLPLNIFENRYIQLVNDCMKENRMFGMVQPKNKDGNTPEVYNIGCLGKIISFNETNDNRFIISLSGITRFRIKKEINKKLLNKIKIFFKKINYPIDYDELEKLDIDQLTNMITMISPFSVEEKQKLIEAVNIENKIKILDDIIKFNLVDFQENKTVQ